jgi:branched-chain amino acid transport system ATP-binding protein
MSSRSPILELKGIRKKFGGVNAVDGVSLDIRQGGVYGLIGPNGSGKSTLFNLVSGLLQPDAGEIRFEGRRIDGLPIRKIFELGISRSFQIPRLFFGMTVFDNLMCAPKGQTGESPISALRSEKWHVQEQVFARSMQALLDELEISGAYLNPASEISGGQMKLLQLAIALATEPKLLLLDEPTAGVAPRIAQDIFLAIEEQRRRTGTTFFIIEHRLDILLEKVDHVFVMHQGKLISEGRPEQVTQDKRVIEAYLGISG